MPTIRQVADDSYECPTCGEKINPNLTLGEVLEGLSERIEELENRNDNT